MGLKSFTANFSSIGHQKFLRFDPDYRNFFDVQNAKIFRNNNIIKLKFILSELPSKKISKGDLEDKEYLIDLGNIERRLNILTDLVKVSNIGSDKNILTKGDIIIPKLQPQMGNFFLNEKHNKYIGSSELIEYKIKKNYNPLFLYYLFTSKKFLNSLINLESGKTHRRVNPDDLIKVKIPLISIEKQNNIIDKIKPLLDRINEQRHNLKPVKEIINKTILSVTNMNMKKAEFKKEEMNHLSSLVETANDELKFDISLKYKYIFNNFVKNQSKFVWIEIGKIADIKGGKRLPKGETLLEEDTGFKYLRVDDLSWSGYFNYENIKFISKRNKDIIKNYIANTNDILLTIVGATVGKCGLLPKILDGENITENFSRLIIKNQKEYLPEYVNYCLQSKLCSVQIEEFKGRGSQGKLALFRIKKIKIPKLQSKDQLKIINQIKKELDYQEELKKKIESQRDNIDEVIYDQIN